MSNADHRCLAGSAKKAFAVRRPTIVRTVKMRMGVFHLSCKFGVYWIPMNLYQSLLQEPFLTILSSQPPCDASTQTGAINASVRIAYYSAAAAGRDCDGMQPEGIPAGPLTHVNVAFEGVSNESEITDQYGPVVARVSRLKRRHNGLRVNIAVGAYIYHTMLEISTIFETRANEFPNCLVHRRICLQ